jgi:predicted enzyme related to lactoylglutathione lyase
MPRVIHFEIHATHPQQSMDFYTALLGWTFSKWGPMDYWLIETGPEGEMGINGALQPRQGPPPTETQAVNAFVCTAQVTGLDALVTKAVSMGGALALPKMPVTGMGWVAYIKDPDGNLLGMIELDEKAA